MSLLSRSNALVKGRRRRGSPGRGYIPLLHRVAGLNVVLVLAAVVVTVLVLAPGKVSSLAVDAEVLVVVAAVLLVVVANLYLLRRIVAPLQALTGLARRVDLTSPGQRMPGATPTSEAGELALTFNEMLDRLESERREATARVLAGQEAERLRIAQELHDQVGQELTAVLLGLSRVQARAPGDLHEDLISVQDTVRSSLEDVKRIAIELRPEALDDLGLESALVVLAQRVTERLGLEVRSAIGPGLPALRPEIELVVYRVAQEALTNVARHSGAHEAELTLAHHDGQLALVVRDPGRGMGPSTPPGAGMRGMRERATLIGGRLVVENGRGGGSEVRLEVPVVGAQ